MSCKCKNKPNIGRGASFCHKHEEIQAQIHKGCYKLHETNWLEEYPQNETSDIVEIRFKNTRRSYYRNVNNLDLKEGDIVAVESSPGHDIGVVSLIGDMVSRQMRRVGFHPQNGEYKKIYRHAKPYDIEKWQEAIELEHETMILSRQIAADMGLNMKIGDVEYQGDKIKAIFYYIADERVDFRELIKVFAEKFHIRIEMKQIGARQEAGRIGGLGACGRELCCASWISSFTSVTTNSARQQELSLNPLKLAGQCSKLKCCLTYEYDTYVDARKQIPYVKEPLQAMDGEYHLFKSDILAGTMNFTSSKDNLSNMVTLPVDRVKEIIEINKAGKKVEHLQRSEDMPQKIEEPTYRTEEDSITRFDKKKRSKNSKNRSNNRNENGKDRDERNGERADRADRGERRENSKSPRNSQHRNKRTNEQANAENLNKGADNVNKANERQISERNERGERGERGERRNSHNKNRRRPKNNSSSDAPRQQGGAEQQNQQTSPAKQKPQAHSEQKPQTTQKE